MRVFKNVLWGLALLLWSAVSAGQQPTPAPPAAGAETRSPPPAAGTERPSPPAASREAGTPPREAGTPPPAAAPADVNEGEFIPSEELAPDAAVTFPVDI